jgi:hypothetical protein
MFDIAENPIYITKSIPMSNPMKPGGGGAFPLAFLPGTE